MGNQQTKFVVSALLPDILEILEDEPIPQHTSSRTGQDYYNELMESENWNRFRDICRMDKTLFKKLLKLLVEECGLQDGKVICAGEKLMIFIQCLKGHPNRTIGETWQHSGSTISTIIHEVTLCFMLNCNKFFIQPDPTTPVSPQIFKNPRFYPYFKDCIGAVDGTHIPLGESIPFEEQKPFRNRKGFLSQNVLGVAGFDLTFSYALGGWEGFLKWRSNSSKACVVSLPASFCKASLIDN